MGAYCLWDANSIVAKPCSPDDGRNHCPILMHRVYLLWKQPSNVSKFVDQIVKLWKEFVDWLESCTGVCGGQWPAPKVQFC